MSKLLANRSGWSLSALFALVCVVAYPSMARAQVPTCGGQANYAGTVALKGNPIFVGDTVRIHANIGPTDITGGTTMTINTYQHALDCKQASGLTVGTCVDQGDVIGFVGFVSTTCLTAGSTPVAWNCSAA